jgi:hypothetical protein
MLQGIPMKSSVPSYFIKYEIRVLKLQILRGNKWQVLNIIIIIIIIIVILIIIITIVNVKLSPCLTKHRSMKTYWGNGSISPRIL